MKKKTEVPFRNKSRTGWWLYREVEKWVPNRKETPTAKSRYPVWENTRIIKAKNRDEAYAKAMQLGRSTSPSKTDGGAWRFVGISQLLPIYEKLEDGAEIMWDDLGNLSLVQIKKRVKTKKQLPVLMIKKIKALSCGPSNPPSAGTTDHGRSLNK